MLSYSEKFRPNLTGIVVTKTDRRQQQNLLRPCKERIAVGVLGVESNHHLQTDTGVM